MARPTKLTSELVDKAEKYLGEFVMGGLYNGELPMRASFSIYLDVSRDSVNEWAKLDTPLGKRFSDVVEGIDAAQEYKLIGKSLKNEYNPTITKLLLSSNHGYAESSKIDHTTGGEKIALVEFIGHGDAPDSTNPSTS